jgi:hypothetical protein
VRAYQIFQLNKLKKLVSGSVIQAADDETACTTARALASKETYVIEVWNGALRVATIDCELATD